MPCLLVVHHTPSPALQAGLEAVRAGVALVDDVELPYAVYVHGNDDTAGALAGVQRITGALGWKQVAAPLGLTGTPGPADLAACRELAATVAVGL